ncbi:MAG: DPP IV N-terminal domain-containing protein, partial [Saprospiraceae bacterium]|nr:DPP IV N-terminal domain-containing protein [Saprospiraceae bacterium]
MKHYPLLFPFMFSFYLGAIAQDTLSIEAYDRAIGFLWENHHNKKTFNLHMQIHWFKDTTGFWYLDHAPGSKKYMTVELPEGARGELFDHERVAKLLRDSLHTSVSSEDLPIDAVTKLDSHLLEVSADGHSFILDTERYTLSSTPITSQEDIEGRSPDGKWTTYTKDYNLYVQSTQDGQSRQLSFNGEKNYEYASWVGWADIIEGENGDRPNRFDVNWSNDSQWLFANICDLRSARKMHLLDWSVDTLFRPRVLSYYRGSPGDEEMVYMHPVFFHAKTGRKVRPDLPRSTHINAVRIEWSEQPGKVFLTQTSRGYQKVNVYLLDLETEQMDLVYSESSDTNIDNFEYHLVEGEKLLFYLSEKSGWRQLYARHLETGEEQAIAQGEYYVHEVKHIDLEQKKVFFTGAAMDPNQNPYLRQLYGVSFDGEDLLLLTMGNLNHEVSISPDGLYFVDNRSTVENPTVSLLKSTETGNTIMELGQAQIIDMEGWTPPEPFHVLARDGRTQIYGALWKPSDFDPSKSYPVIEMSYTGPHTQVFPREFDRAFGLQPYAELGFIVMVVDGLGSSGRSKEFHNYSYKNLGGNLED